MPRHSPKPSYGGSVFINCPFDDAYRPIFRAVVFAVAACGFVPRCTLEHDDASQVRIEKIYRLIESSAHSIHDVSRTELDEEHGLPRFNMPLELGVFLGAKRFGRAPHPKKRCLILDRERYRFQKFISDLAGQDIKAHGNQPLEAIRATRDWLRLRFAGLPLAWLSHWLPGRTVTGTFAAGESAVRPAPDGGFAAHTTALTRRG